MANDDIEGQGARPNGDPGAAAGGSAVAPDESTLRSRLAGHAIRNESLTPPPLRWSNPEDYRSGATAGYRSPASQFAPPIGWPAPGWQQPAAQWQPAAAWQPAAQWQQPQFGPGLGAWSAARAAWPIGQVPWGYSNPPTLPPILEPPGSFHPPISRRPTFSLKGRKSPRLYAVGLVVGLPGIAALLLYLVAVAAGFKLPSGPVPAWVWLEAVCVLATIGLVGWAVAQGRQRRADGWQDYSGPSPVVVMGAFLALTTAVELVVAVILKAAHVDVDSAPVTLLVLLIYLATYFGMVHFLAVRTGALTWHEIASPKRLAPSSDDWGSPEPSTGWTRAWGATVDSFRSRLPRSRRFGDVLVAAAMVVPLMLVSNLLSAAMLLVLGLKADDISSGQTVPADGISILITFFAVAIVAPIGEEVFFRGFSTNAWGRSMSHNSAILRASLFFAFIHVMNTATTDASVSWRVAIFNFGARVPVAFALTWLYMRRRSILASGTLHAGYNGLITIAQFL